MKTVKQKIDADDVIAISTTRQCQGIGEYDIVMQSIVMNAVSIAKSQNRLISDVVNDVSFVKNYLCHEEFIIDNFSLTVKSIGQNRTPMIESFNGYKYTHGYQKPETSFEYIRKQLLLYRKLSDKFILDDVSVMGKEYIKQIVHIDASAQNLLSIIEEYTPEYWYHADVSVDNFGITFAVPNSEVTMSILVPANNLSKPIIKLTGMPTIIENTIDSQIMSLAARITSYEFINDIEDDLIHHFELVKQLKKLQSNADTVVYHDIRAEIRTVIRNFVNNRTAVGTVYSVKLTNYFGDDECRTLMLTKTTSVKYNIDVWNKSDGISNKIVDGDVFTYCEYWSQHKNVHKNLTQFITHFMNILNTML